MCAQPGVSVLQTSLVLPLTALALSGYLQKSLVFNLDQGCLHCRLASVLPSAVSSYSRGAGAVGGAWYVKIASYCEVPPEDSLVLDRGVCTAD